MAISKTSLSDRVLVLEEGQGRMEASLGEIKRMLTEGAASRKGDSRYVLGLCIAVATLVGGPMAYFFNSSVESKVSPLQAASAASVKDREGLLRGFETNKDNLTAQGERLTHLEAVTTARFSEMETQIDAASQIENIRLAEIHRLLAIGWPKDRLGEYPILPFIETNISNRKPLPSPSK